VDSAVTVKYHAKLYTRVCSSTSTQILRYLND
jgi:hypothetical protein